MAVPVLQAVGTGVGWATGGQTVSNSTHQADDIQLLLVEAGGNSAHVISLTTAAGFSELSGSPWTTGGASASGTRIHAYWRRCTSGSETAPVVNQTTNHAYARMFTIRGCVTSGNPWDVFNGGNKSSASTSLSVTGNTTTVIDCLVVQALSWDIDNAGPIASAQTNGDLTSITEHADEGTVTGSGGGIALWTGTKATAGTFGATSVTVTSSQNGFVSIAFKPPVGAMTGTTTAAIAGSGAATGAGAMVGSATATVAPTGPLAGAGAMSGSAALTISATGALLSGISPYHQATSSVYNSTGSGSLAWPTHQADDIGLLYLFTTNESVTAPSGWTEIENGGTGTAGASHGVGVMVCWKRAASGAESAVAIPATTYQKGAVILTFRDCYAGGTPIAASNSNTLAYAGADLPPDVSAITNTVYNEALVVASIVTDFRDWHLSGWTNANLTGLAELFDDGNGNDLNLGIAAGMLPAAGNSGTTTATCVAYSAYAMAHIALRPRVPSNGAISGSATLAVTATATATAAGTMAATATLAVAPSSTLGASAALAGTAAAAIADTGTLKGTAGAVGSAPLTFAATLAVDPGATSGSTSFAITATGTLKGTAGAVGSTPLTFADTGSLQGAGAQVGSTSLSVGGTSALGASAAISGTTTISVALTGNMNPGAMRFSGTALAFTATATATLQYGLLFRSKFDAVASARQTLLAKIIERTNELAAVSDVVFNKGFENGAIGWTFDAGWSVEANAIALAGASVAKFTGGASTARIVNTGRVACAAGARITAVAGIYSSSATGLMGTGVRWYNQSGSVISTSEIAYVTPASSASTWVQGRYSVVAPAGTAYGQAVVVVTGYTTGTWYIDQVDLVVQPQDQTDMSPIGVGSVGSLWDGLAISYTVPTTGSPATVTIDVSAATLRAGAVSIAYNSSSGTVSQARSSTVTYQLYYLDAVYGGGSCTLNITDSAADIANANDVIWVGQVSVTVPTLGSGSSGGGNPGGGGCVATTMWLDATRQAGNVQPGDWIECALPAPDASGTQSRCVLRNASRVEPCHQIITESGASLVASNSTPMTLPDGSTAWLPDMLGQLVLVSDDGGLGWERVVVCEPVGLRSVAHISVGGNTFFAGLLPGRRIASHNMAKPTDLY